MNNAMNEYKIKINAMDTCVDKMYEIIDGKIDNTLFQYFWNCWHMLRDEILKNKYNCCGHILSDEIINYYNNVING